MPQLQEEAHRGQRGLPALRPALRQRKILITIVVVALAIAAIFDWTRPPRSQVSVVLYNKIVIGGYRLILQPAGRHFIRCRFRPTCSVYSEEAMLAHGFPKGVWLTTSRLFRCMPWVPFGTEDRVPE